MKSVKLSVQELLQKTKINPDWSFANYSRSETAKWTHCYHRYPAKFIPQLVEKLFDEYLPKSSDIHINDPFFGSGTTIVSAISRGYRGSGTDINGIAYLMTHAKSVPIEPSLLETRIKRFLKDSKPSSTNTRSSDFDLFDLDTKNIERIDYWFSEENKNELGRILNIILEETDSTIQKFLLTAFSHILKGCSLWLQRSTKPTRDKRKVPRDPYISIKHHLKKMVSGNNAFYQQVPRHIYSNIHDYLNISLNDARKQPVDDSCVDLIVTSSPYVTSYEYADLHQLSTLWLNLADDYKEYRRSFIGSGFRNPSKKIPKSETANEIVSELYDKHERTSLEVSQFFCDMDEVFQESYRILKPNGRCCFVIGDTRIKSVDILNAEVFAESLLLSGFQIDRIINRVIPTKILPQTRDKNTGRFSSTMSATSTAYPTEYIVIGIKKK